MGFVLGVFRPNDMIGSVLQKLQPEGIDVGLIDAADLASEANVPISRFAHRANLTQWPIPPDSSIRPACATWSNSTCREPWTIIFSPTPEFEAAIEPGGRGAS